MCTYWNPVLRGIKIPEWVPGLAGLEQTGGGEQHMVTYTSTCMYRDIKIPEWVPGLAGLEQTGGGKNICVCFYIYMYVYLCVWIGLEQTGGGEKHIAHINTHPHTQTYLSSKLVPVSACVNQLTLSRPRHSVVHKVSTIANVSL